MWHALVEAGLQVAVKVCPWRLLAAEIVVSVGMAVPSRITALHKQK